MKNAKIALLVAAVTLALAAVAALGSARPAGAIIHEIVGASCSVNGAPEPPGQSPFGPSSGNSTLRALQATGVITSIVATPTNVTVNFDLSQPNAKLVSAGFTAVILNFFGPGVSLTLNPLPTLNGSTFPAFLHCANLP
jgi:hypothetical protein